MKRYFIYYVIAINLIGCFAMFLDKQKAKRGAWRIPEKTLFLFALLGGSFGTTMGMHLFHHKTRHWYFRFGMPLILLLQLSIFAYVKGSGLF